MARLSEEEITRGLGSLEGWRREGDTIEKDFEQGDFQGSVDFVNRLAPVADEMNHHPDLSVTWSTVKVSITTHSEGGLTANDFELARKLGSLG